MGPFFSNHQRVMKNDGTEVTLQLPLTTAGEWRFKSEGRHRRAWMDRRGWLGSGSSRGGEIAAGCCWLQAPLFAAIIFENQQAAVPSSWLLVVLQDAVVWATELCQEKQPTIRIQRATKPRITIRRRATNPPLTKRTTTAEWKNLQKKVPLLTVKVGATLAGSGRRPMIRRLRKMGRRTSSPTAIERLPVSIVARGLEAKVEGVCVSPEKLYFAQVTAGW